MADVKFTDFSVEVKGEIDERIFAVLEECAGEIESQTKRNSRVDTGFTKNSFQHKVTGSFMANEFRAYNGSNEENAIWEELGTGEYALGGNGRKDGWRYQDANGEWHYTRGKTPSRAFYKAYIALKDVIINHIKNSLKGM